MTKLMSIALLAGAKTQVGETLTVLSCQLLMINSIFIYVGIRHPSFWMAFFGQPEVGQFPRQFSRQLDRGPPSIWNWLILLPLVKQREFPHPQWKSNMEQFLLSRGFCNLSDQTKQVELNILQRFNRAWQRLGWEIQRQMKFRGKMLGLIC